MIKNNSEDLKSGLDCGFSYTSLVLNVLTTDSRLFWLLFIITSSWWPGHSWTLASVVCHDHCCHILKFMRNYYGCGLQSFGVQKFGSDGQGGIYNFTAGDFWKQCSFVISSHNTASRSTEASFTIPLVPSDSVVRFQLCYFILFICKVLLNNSSMKSHLRKYL